MKIENVNAGNTSDIMSAIILLAEKYCDNPLEECAIPIIEEYREDALYITGELRKYLSVIYQLPPTELELIKDIARKFRGYIIGWHNIATKISLLYAYTGEERFKL